MKCSLDVSSFIQGYLLSRSGILKPCSILDHVKSFKQARRARPPSDQVCQNLRARGPWHQLFKFPSVFENH